MFSTYFYTYSAVIIVSLISFIGVLSLALKQEVIQKISLYLVSFSAGTLLGDVFIHLLPEAADKNNSLTIWLTVLFGILFFFVLEKLICWRHCHIPTSEKHPHPVGVMNLIGDAFHNFFDGLIIAGSFMISLPLGIATSIAVIAHEIPQEIGDFGVLLHANFTRKKALLLNFAIALMSVFGAALALTFGNSFLGFTEHIVPFTAGGFIYIATADLIPELKKDNAIIKSTLQLILIILGIALMLALKYLTE